MKILSRIEELILVSIAKLGEDAYCVTILTEAQKHSGKKWKLSDIYIPLGRLESKEYLHSWLGDPTPERGGKSKRYYKLTRLGVEALKEVRKVEQSMWDGLSEVTLDKMV